MPDASTPRGEGHSGNGGGTADWPQLKPVGPDPSGPAVRLNKSVCIVGARSKVHLPLESPMVSKAHALIVNGGPLGVYVRDLASRNHVYVNGSRVREADLRPADLLRIGPFTFSCCSGFDRGDYAGHDQGRLKAAATDWRDNEGATQAAAAAELHIEGRGVRVPLHGRTFLVGARAECDLPLNGPGVSPVHAVIFQREGEWWLRDLNSDDGTFMNGRRARESPLRPDDVIRVGVVEMRYVVPAAAAEASSGMTEAESTAALAEASDAAFGFGVSVPGDELATSVEVTLPAPMPAPPDSADLPPGSDSPVDEDEPIPLEAFSADGATEAEPEPVRDAAPPTVPPSAHRADVELIPLARADAGRPAQRQGAIAAIGAGAGADHDWQEPVVPTFDIPTFDDLDWPAPDPAEAVVGPVPPADRRQPEPTLSDSHPGDAEPVEARVLERRLTRVVRTLSRNVARLGATWRDLRAGRSDPAPRHGRDPAGRAQGTADKRSPER